MSGISIVLTYYKGEKFIENCINSLIDSYEASSKLLAYEIVMVIDSMEDADRIESLLSKKYKDHHLIIIKNEKNIGVAESRNRGLKTIKNTFYTIIDQDDYVKSNYFSVLEKELDTDNHIHLINGVIRYPNEKIEVPIYYFRPEFEFKSIILKTTFIYTPGLVIFNSNHIPGDELFIDTSETYKGCDDWAAYLNLILKAKGSLKYKYINSPLFVYCLHGSNYSNNKEEMIRSSTAVLEFLSHHPDVTIKEQRLIAKSFSMQKLYFSKDVNNSKAIQLFYRFPRQFLFHYFLSLFNLSNTNKLISKLSYVYKRQLKISD
ncbi:glycosyltransferase family 2 protein [Pedobacter suwonensis]|uniref:glycosyltransferase family 2 protein n=1 Tax=Pedobacter suwonensis TaxID=332999 RepID=UPI0011A752C5|nr:glycosyltransferase [Pedobacter suwonensis]